MVRSVYLLVFLSFWHCGIAERIPESPIPFRDRNGNSVELSDYVATYKQAENTESVQIVTRPGFDISKMETDFQRSHVIFFSGQFKSKIGNPPGNLYVIFTENVRYCNSSAVAYEVVGDFIVSDMKTNVRNTEIQLQFGHMGKIEISKGLLAHIFRKLDIDAYYDKLNCQESLQRPDGLHTFKRTSCGSSPVLDGVSMDSYEKFLGDVMTRHSEIVDDIVRRSSNYISTLTSKLHLANQRLSQNTGINPITIDKRPVVNLQMTEDLRSFLMGKIDETCERRNSEGTTVSQAKKWKDELKASKQQIDRLQIQLHKVKHATLISSRFGEEDDANDSWVVMTPYDAMLNTTNYSCIPLEEIEKCVKNHNIIGNTTKN